MFELERAVMQLQQRVFQLEGKPSTPVSDCWACTLTAMGETYTATGGSKAVASVNVVEKCAAARKDRFFCKDPKCEN
ncbi:MAG: hypothetical protein IPM97_08140 [Bdellovibrionaceae bacterium]|nr:hypothetical protein [Pseudobdellovibrionaceae bacterium]